MANINAHNLCCLFQYDGGVNTSLSCDSIIFCDLRTSMLLAKTILSFASNSTSWNSVEAFNIAVASEDHNISIFDMRNMGRALNVLKDHVVLFSSHQQEKNLLPRCTTAQYSYRTV
jgi:hypothetical protein